MRLPPGPSLSSLELQQIFLANPFPFFDECRASYGDIFTLDLGNFGYRKHNANGLWVLVCGEKYNKLLSELDPKACNPGAAAMISSAGVMPQKSFYYSNDKDRSEQNSLLRDLIDKRDSNRKDTLQELDTCIEDVLGQSADSIAKAKLGDLIALVIFNTFYNTVFESKYIRESENLKQVFLEALHAKRKPDAIRQSIHKASPFLDQMIQEAKDALPSDVDTERSLCAIDLLILAQRKDNLFSDLEIRDNLIAYFINRATTCFGVISWALVWLSREPSVLERVLKDLESNNQTKLDYRKEKLSYLVAVVKEVFRISPFQSLHSHQLVEKPITLGEFDIPPGTIIASVPFLTHRSPSVYKNPERFDPNHFLANKYSMQSFTPFNVNSNQRFFWESHSIHHAAVVLAKLLNKIDLSKSSMGVVPELHQSFYLPSSIYKAEINLKGRSLSTEGLPA